MSLQETRGLGKKVHAVGGNHESTTVMHNKESLGKSQWSGNSRGGFAQGEAGHNARGWGVEGTHSRRAESNFYGTDEPVASRKRGCCIRIEKTVTTVTRHDQGYSVL
jgi:hypothetical protein